MIKEFFVGVWHFFCSKYFSIVIMWVVFSNISNVLFVQSHENYHEQVCEQMLHGEANISIWWDGADFSGETRCSEPHTFEATRADLEGEMFGYHMKGILLSSWLMIFFVAFVLFVIFDKER